VDRTTQPEYWANAETRDKYLLHLSQTNKQTRNVCLFVNWDKQTNERQVKNIKRINSRSKPIFNGTSGPNLLRLQRIFFFAKNNLFFAKNNLLFAKNNLFFAKNNHIIIKTRFFLSPILRLFSS